MGMNIFVLFCCHISVLFIGNYNKNYTLLNDVLPFTSSKLY